MMPQIPHMASQLQIKSVLKKQRLFKKVSGFAEASGL
jgi:hypothetical protein